MTLPKVIGLTGHMYAGKSTVALYLQREHGYTVMAFADALKRMLIDAGMCSWEECYAKKTERSRWLMQKVGTEIFRKQVHPDFWVQRVALKVQDVLNSDGRVVFDDLRFPNEAKLVRAYLGDGTLIRVVRDEQVAGTRQVMGAEGIVGHESEAAVDTIEADYLIKARTGDLDALYSQVEYILKNRLGKAAAEEAKP